MLTHDRTCIEVLGHILYNRITGARVRVYHTFSDFARG